MTTSLIPQMKINELRRKGKRELIPIRRGTYLEVLKNIAIEMRKKNEVLTVLELQKRFEKKIYEELLKQNPRESELDITLWVGSFRNGAQAAQIRLNTINDRNRIHYRSPLHYISEFNQFILLEPDRNQPYLNKKITFFDKTKPEYQEYELVYSKSKGHLDKILIKDILE